MHGFYYYFNRRRGESPCTLKGTYSLRASRPLKQKMGHKETIASRRTKNVFFLSAFTCIEFNYCVRRLSSLWVEASCLFLKNIQRRFRMPRICGCLGLVEAAFLRGDMLSYIYGGGEKSIGN